MPTDLRRSLRDKRPLRANNTQTKKSDSFHRLSSLQSSLPNLSGALAQVNPETYPDHVERFRVMKLMQLHPKKLQDLRSTADTLREAINTTNQQFEYQGPSEGIGCDSKQRQQNLQKLGTKIAQAASELSRLQEPPHPIRRCPRDIMQHLFELFVISLSDDRDCFRRAICLSHVCYRWRNIALDTSIIWEDLRFNLCRPASQIQETWSEIVARSKARRVNITISLIRDTILPFRALRRVNFDVFPDIGTLAFELREEHDAGRVVESLKSVLRLPSNGIRQLVIKGFPRFREFRLDPRTIISDFSIPHVPEALHSFHKLESIDLQGFDFDFFSSGSIFNHIVSLSLRNSTNLHFDTLVHAFPNVKHLGFYHCTEKAVDKSRKEHHVWPNVKSLVICDQPAPKAEAQLLPLYELRFPELQDLCLPSCSDSRFVEFVERHPSLRTIDTIAPWWHFLRKNIPLPHLTSLSVSFKEEPDHESISSLAFPPLLAHLALYEDKRGFSCQEFDKIVQSRHVAGKSSSSDSHQLQPSLTIFCKVDEKPGDWQGSTWIPLSCKSESIVTRWNQKYQSFHFHWPEGIPMASDEAK